MSPDYFLPSPAKLAIGDTLHSMSGLAATKRHRRFALCFALITMQALAGPYEEGVAAYDQGQFATAFKLWLPLRKRIVSNNVGNRLLR